LTSAAIISSCPEAAGGTLVLLARTRHVPDLVFGGCAIVESKAMVPPFVAPHAARRRALAVALLIFAPLSLVWEILQMPLYTIWRTESSGRIAFAILHCTVGDVLIGAASLFATLAIAGRGWPAPSRLRVLVIATAFGVAYTVFSEWLNVSVRGTWAYEPYMPTLPVLGTGLSPLLQWIILPPVVLMMAGRTMESRAPLPK
jgi:hypothetical protein